MSVSGVLLNWHDKLVHKLGGFQVTLRQPLLNFINDRIGEDRYCHKQETLLEAVYRDMLLALSDLDLTKRTNIRLQKHELFKTFHYESFDRTDVLPLILRHTDAVIPASAILKYELMAARSKQQEQRLRELTEGGVRSPGGDSGIGSQDVASEFVGSPRHVSSAAPSPAHPEPSPRNAPSSSESESNVPNATSSPQLASNAPGNEAAASEGYVHASGDETESVYSFQNYETAYATDVSSGSVIDTSDREEVGLVGPPRLQTEGPPPSPDLDPAMGADSEASTIIPPKTEEEELVEFEVVSTDDENSDIGSISSSSEPKDVVVKHVNPIPEGELETDNFSSDAEDTPSPVAGPSRGMEIVPLKRRSRSYPLPITSSWAPPSSCWSCKRPLKDMDRKPFRFCGDCWKVRQENIVQPNRRRKRKRQETDVSTGSLSLADQPIPDAWSSPPMKRRPSGPTTSASTDSQPSGSSSSSSVCVACQDGPKDYTLIHGRTGHRCVCQTCAKRLFSRSLSRRTCPICMRRIERYVKTFEV